MKQRRWRSPLQLNIVVIVPTIAIGKKKKIKGINTTKEKSVFADDMIVYTENPKEIYKKATRTN